ncbi:MAG: hypothetical protein K2F94_11265 [Muribaculaceae bacterium]|nr:hypothetical protein [Muribaculaceae bacterium]
MRITLPYQQLNEYIVAKTKQQITLSFVNDKEIKITYAKKILIKEINIGLNIKIESVTPSEIVLLYQAPAGLDVMITGAITFLSTKLPELISGIHMADGHRIYVNLDKIKKLKSVVQNISLQDITFNDTNATIEFSLKY